MRIHSTYTVTLFIYFISGKIFTKPLPFLVFTLLFSDSFSQSTCTTSVDAGNDTTLCAAATIRLHGSTTARATDIRSILWQPSTGISNPATLSPNANITGSATYYLTVTSTSGSNIIVNGDFSAGLTGFTTSYTPGIGGTFGLLSNAGTYAITTNPRNVHNNYSIFGDHTTGTGNMLVANGDTIPNVNLYCQTVAVVPNTNYVFSTWVASCVPSSPAVLQFIFNGIQVGANFSAPAIAATWSQFTQIWNSGSNTSATICILDQNILVSGNDFAIDDISMREICVATDSVAVTLVTPGIIYLGIDTTICNGDSVRLDATTPNATTYLWSTGENTSTITVNLTGTYWATAIISSACPISDSIDIVVKKYPQIYLGADTFLCSDAGLLLNASSPLATSYQWNNGSSSATLTAFSAGQYWVHVANGSCISGDTIQILKIILPGFSLGNDTSVCIPDSVVLHVPPFPGNQYTWFDGSHVQTQSITKEGTYWLQMEDSGCTSKEFVTISSGDCGIVFIPNSFSPNGDNKNDSWRVFPYSVSTINVKVFDRWGELIFSSDQPDFSWDGIYGGRYIEQGVYNYFISGIYISGNEYSFRGILIVIR